jgi:hypothetical protein
MEEKIKSSNLEIRVLEENLGKIGFIMKIYLDYISIRFDCEG